MVTMMARRMLGWIAKEVILAVVRVSTSVRQLGRPVPASAHQQGVYFANHTSLADFLLIWTVMPTHQRRKTRPVAAEDYWNASWLRRFLAQEVFNALLIKRASGEGEPSAVDLMAQALGRGESLIIFPEGTRNTTEAWLTPFKCGLYLLGREYPQVPLIPVWLHNIRHVMPKGVWLPVPMVCTVHVGAPLSIRPSEQADEFLVRAQEAVLKLRPTSAHAEEEDEAVAC